MEASYETAAKALDELLEGLRSQAEAIVTAHVDAAKSKDEKLSWPERSNLRLFVRDGGVYEWSRVKWYGPKGSRRMVRVYIAKPRGAYMYTLSKLLAHAQPWEAPMVEATEKKLAPLRKQQAFVTKAKTYLRYAMRAAVDSEMTEEERDVGEQIDT